MNNKNATNKRISCNQKTITNSFLGQVALSFSSVGGGFLIMKNK